MNVILGPNFDPEVYPEPKGEGPRAKACPECNEGTYRSPSGRNN